jgi:L-asparaginase|tara:strand:+ start:8876 stop:9853 length:978 start_codon:yes stop_codon:yes gene_type:complete
MPILCRVTRGELTESIHVVFAVAVDESGQIFSTGDPYYLTCIRSSLKPFQAASSIKAGAIDKAGFSDEEIALMCGSHYGEPIHIKTAKSMLKKIGLTVDDYECGSHFPTDKDSRYGLIKHGIKPDAFHNNCSGKHAGMLAFAKYLKRGITGYIKKDHPVQESIFGLLNEYTGMETIPTGIDGCSAPTPFMPLETIAGLFQKLGSGVYPELNRVYNAMCDYPQLVGGTHHFDSIFIDVLSGRGITKIGGEAVRGITIKKPDGGCVGIALKVLDGNFRALPIATMKLLEHLELLSNDELKKLDKFRTKILRNHNQKEIGQIEAYIDT